MFKFSCLLLLFLVSSGFQLSAQLSDGGYPLEISFLKSSVKEVEIVKMPAFDLQKAKNSERQSLLQKSVVFAHTFEVEFTTENAGQWFQFEGYNVWRFQVKSDSALSLNLLFSKFYLPQGARLFIFDPQKEVVLGAFTSKNNKSYKKLATYPLPGDEMIVQYEEPINASFKGELEIGKINHDFLGVVSTGNRWDRRLSESCNVDVNCETTSGFELQKRSVCRVLAQNELGSGTLLNNTSEGGKPYFITAFHVVKKGDLSDVFELAEETLFDFNYESPFCTGINGYDQQSISGATALAAFDSMDVILMEMSEIPPAVYRPYFAGWDATNSLPSNSYCIHHPNGDVKKITHDTGICDSMIYSNEYLKYSHWKVLNWESGSTESGSSGGGLFDGNKRIVGTLTGGVASCDNNSYDSFARFDRMWNARADSSLQLECWLDSMGSGKTKIDGFDPYESTESNCSVVSNFMLDDELELVNDQLEALVVNEVAERFNQFEKVSLSGVSIGIEDFSVSSVYPEIVIRIYSGDEVPAFDEKQFKFAMSSLTRDAMNYFNFDESVELEGTFFIGVDLVNDEDFISLYRSNFRSFESHNSMLINDNGVWNSIASYDENGLGASLLFQATLCSVSLAQANDTIEKEDVLMKVYPNPARNYITVEFKERDEQHDIRIYDRVGRLLYEECFEGRMYADIDVSDFLPGIYLINFENEEFTETQRLMILKD